MFARSGPLHLPVTPLRCKVFVNARGSLVPQKEASPGSARPGDRAAVAELPLSRPCRASLVWHLSSLLPNGPGRVAERLGKGGGGLRATDPPEGPDSLLANALVRIPERLGQGGDGLRAADPPQSPRSLPAGRGMPRPEA